MVSLKCIKIARYLVWATHPENSKHAWESISIQGLSDRRKIDNKTKVDEEKIVVGWRRKLAAGTTVTLLEQTLWKESRCRDSYGYTNRHKFYIETDYATVTGTMGTELACTIGFV